MTDNRTTIAGNYPGQGWKGECILNEGVPTVTATTFMQTGESIKTATFAAAPYQLEEGQVVALSNDTANTYQACEGMPVVERAQNGEALVIGQIISTPRWKVFPATSGVATPWATQLAGKYYRTAIVQFHIPGQVVCAEIMHDGTRTVVQGVATTVNFNIGSAYTSLNDGYYFDLNTANGVGCVPLHYVAAGTDGDLSDCLVILTGFLYAVTGA